MAVADTPAVAHRAVAARYLLLWFLGLYLRLGILAVPPLIPRLESVLGFSASQSATLTSLPMLLIGLGALVGGWFIARLGVSGALLAGLAVMAAGSGLRSLPAPFLWFTVATVIMGLGIALMQTALPALTRSWMPDRVGRAAAVYSNGLLSGELIAAGLTGPLVHHWLGEMWLLAFTAWMLPVPLLMLAVARLAGGDHGGGRGSGTPILPDWRDPLLWRLALVLSSAGVLYFCGNIFLPGILAGSGRLHLLDAALAALNGSQLLSSAVLIVYTDRLLGRHWPLYAITAAALLTVPAMVWAPGAWVVWASAAFGALTSSLLIFALALPAWLVPQDQVPRLAAGMLGAAYTLVFLVPVLGSWLAQAANSYAVGFAPVVALALAAIAVTGGIRPRAH